MQHTESMIGDMWNFVNLGKRVDGCEDTLETVIHCLKKVLLEVNLIYLLVTSSLRLTLPFHTPTNTFLSTPN